MADQYDGIGGSYIVDKNGVRTLVERTQDEVLLGEQHEATEPEPAPATPSTSE